ncbi:UNVERIFIED_CONTAM: hypothetical protein FKN15_040948 [Acipenser sinensis]
MLLQTTKAIQKHSAPPIQGSSPLSSKDLHLRHYPLEIFSFLLAADEKSGTAFTCCRNSQEFHHRLPGPPCSYLRATALEDHAALGCLQAGPQAPGQSTGVASAWTGVREICHAKEPPHYCQHFHLGYHTPRTTELDTSTPEHLHFPPHQKYTKVLRGTRSIGTYDL